jgi:hypothetical protein
MRKGPVIKDRAFVFSAASILPAAFQHDWSSKSAIYITFWPHFRTLFPAENPSQNYENKWLNRS